MSNPESTATESSPAKHSRRLWFLMVFDLLATVGILAIWFLLPEQFDRGTRSIFTVMVLIVAAAAFAVWFFGLARVSARARFICAAVLLLLVVGVAASVRRVEFTGDMVPTFDFRWTPDRYEILEAHRASQRADASPAEDAKNDTPNAPVEGNTWSVLDYRGADRTGVIPGPALARTWDDAAPRLVWRQPVGGGYASFVIKGPLVITIEQRRNEEAIAAYDFDTGRERWIHAYPAVFSEQMGGDGPRATPVIVEDAVYALGATGVLTCLELATGEPRWSLNILEQNGSQNLTWGMSGSPLVYDGLVLVNPGNQDGTARSRSITTFDLATGSPRFDGGETTASYASPMLVTLDGVRQVLVFDAEGLAGYNATNGNELWRTPWKSDVGVNAAQPIVIGNNSVFISSSAGAALYELQQEDDRWQVDEVWQNFRMKCGYACPIAYQGYVYGIDENILVCLELATGKRMWKDRDGQYGHGQLLRRDDLLVVLGEAGELALVEATPKGFHELGRIQAIEGKTWNNPALAGNRIFVRNHLEMAAYDLPIAP